MNSPDMQNRIRSANELLKWARGMTKEIETISNAVSLLLCPDVKASRALTVLKAATNRFGFFDDIDTKPFLAELAEVIEHEKEAMVRRRTGERQATYRRRQRKPDGNVTYIAAKKRNGAAVAAPEDGGGVA